MSDTIGISHEYLVDGSGYVNDQVWFDWKMLTLNISCLWNMEKNGIDRYALEMNETRVKKASKWQGFKWNGC